MPQPLVALWGGRTRTWAIDTWVRVIDGVTVVAGIGLHQWAAALEPGALNAAQRDAVTQALQKIAIAWESET